ncbi:MAG: EAL domain-containing protein [Gammaproteobacteria bacterium]|nr:EAL domain-containing protein [Gammaproteobacteria bacterium]MDH5799896.1 EAL domain-containing protein [Gammaproteobacteria bacterium]
MKVETDSPIEFNNDVNNILVVDDDPVISALVSSLLGLYGIRVHGASCLKEAYHACQVCPPDLILLDYALPDGSGLEFIETLRAKDEPLPPIIMLTWRNDNTIIERCLDKGVTDFIPKPVNPQLLSQRVIYTLRASINERELHTKRKQLVEIQKIAGIAYWEFDPVKRTVFCTEELFELLNRKEQDLDISPEEFLALIHPGDRDFFSSLFSQTLHPDLTFQLEHRMLGESDETVYVQEHGEVVNADNRHLKLTCTVQNISDKVEYDLQLHQQLSFDELTKLPKLRLLIHQLNELIIAKKTEQLGVICIGIDRFKQINDSFGYDKGNKLLLQLSDRLNQCGAKLIGRISGDIFILVTPSTKAENEIQYFIDNLTQQLHKTFTLDQHEIYLTFSLGTAFYPKQHGNGDMLIQYAESAMFVAKAKGGNRQTRYQKSSINIASERLATLTELRKAIGRENFTLYYQPQVSVSNRSLQGMEALIRWQHPEKGLIPPDQFIPLAEETGLIVPIGRWALRTAANQVSQWIAAGYGKLKVGVNLSAQQFEDAALIKDVEKVLADTGIPPGCLDLELTESCVMSDIGRTINILSAFREMGVQTSMDDFGTGYSSLSSLKHMPLQTLKIDRSFIWDIQPNGENGEIAKLIIALCHTLNMNVIAEGVETQEQMNFLVQHNCNEAQGFYISRPLPEIVFEKKFLNPHNNRYRSAS